ncbi:MAG: hypothetical protein KMY54_10580 [Erysipelothrix sp.]|nr:hypothetical protein [Erysipelothrix sp.]
MLKFVKLLIIALLLAGCAKPIEPDPDPEPEPNEEELFKDPQGNKILSPVSIPFVYGNPIRIIDKNSDKINSFEISGLKNKVIENKINQEIAAKIDLFLSYLNPSKLPPFRGIYAKIPADASVSEYYIYAYPTFNFNNVLSISFHGWFRYDIKGTPEYINISDALNYDLTSGKHLTVSDLLTNDSNPQKALSDPLSKIIAKSVDSPPDSWFWDRVPFELVAPFKGIKGNQTFYISNTGFHFIFDYRNPEFEYGFSSIPLQLTYSKVMPYVAITERFLTDKDIYESPIRQAEFLDISENMMRNEEKSITYLEVDIYTSKFLSADVSQFYIDKLPDVLTLIYELIDDNIDEYNIESAYGTVSADIVGEYVTLNMYYSIYTNQAIIYHDWSATYDADGNILTLDDLFVDGYFYRDVLWAQLLETYPGYENYDKEAILDNLNFSIQLSGMSFSSSIPATETAEAQMFSFYVPYSTFGMKNLTLFGYE